MRFLTRAVGLFAGACLLTTSTAIGQDRVGKTSQPLITESDVVLWTTYGNQIPVCWDTPGWTREKAIVRAALKATWEYWAKVDFTGWGACPTGVGIGGSGTQRDVRVRIGTQGKENAGAGGQAVEGTAALSSANDNEDHVNLSFAPTGQASQSRVEYVAVHEFGHVLGFAHEQDAPGNEGPDKCTNGLAGTVGIPITRYDRDSVMNYCNRDGNDTGHLTDVDIEGVQKTYGVRTPANLNLNTCSSRRTLQRASLVAPWNDSGSASFAVYPSTGSAFSGWSQWNIRDGGWGDTVKWVTGDFNGDGRTDVGAIWNNGGTNTLTVRLSNGTKFTQQHWLVNAGGWMDSTVWMAGDFNGDGRSDLAAAWNNGGKSSVAVYLSDGSKFAGWTQWSDRDGGWGDTIKWFSGDFNGDGRTDIGAAWNNNGHVTLTVRLSNGRGFTPAHWVQDGGDWWNTSTYLAGDFNGDGREDVAQIWNDMAQTSIRVWLSNGVAFNTATDWSLRDGGWSPTVRWAPGDFNGDGRTDIVAAWNNGGTNTLTVRAASGRQFVQSHWLVNAGGWIASTAWCSGRF